MFNKGSTKLHLLTVVAELILLLRKRSSSFGCYLFNLTHIDVPHVLFLFAAIDYIQYLQQQKKKSEEEVDNLRKEVMALKIMKA